MLAPLPLSVVELPIQIDAFVADAETIGLLLPVTITSSNDGGQLPLEIVQRKVFAPTPMAVKPEIGDVGVVIVAVPETKVHNPVPTTGVLPVRVEVEVQIV